MAARGSTPTLGTNLSFWISTRNHARCCDVRVAHSFTSSISATTVKPPPPDLYVVAVSNDPPTSRAMSTKERRLTTEAGAATVMPLSHAN